MKKLFLSGLAAVVVLLVGFFILSPYFYNEKQATVSTDYKNVTYLIEGQSIKLVNGEAESETAPGSASKIVTKYFGNDLQTDLNGDGREDIVFLLTQNLGGSGTFYYVVAALNTPQGYVGSDGYLLGDRIAPQTIELSPNPKQVGVIVANYADRAPGQPMTTQPSVGKSAYLKLDTASMMWGVVEPNFEGEADPSKMTLGMKTWNWVHTTYNNDTTITPKTNKFTLTLKNDNTFSATTDCNGVGGEYTVTGSKITFTNMRSTLMFCEGSQEQDYTKMLDAVQSYLFTSKGELVFDLKLDTGTMIFR